MAGEQHYDVIVIGTGAGGGTLAHRLAPTGKKVLLLERGDYLPRERDNWDSTAVFVAGQVPGAGVLAGPPRRRVPAGGQLLRRRQHQVLRRGAVPAAAAGLRRVAPPRRHLAGLADQLRGSRAVLHPGRAPVSGARRARRGSHRRRGEPAVPLRAGRARTADPAVERRPGQAGPAPVPSADRREPDPGSARRAPPTPARASAATGSTGSPAWCRPSPTRR